MDFLRFTPTVFVIDKDYEILIVTNEAGKCAVSVGENFYFDESAGVFVSGRMLHKIRIPQSELDKAGKYTVIYCKTVKKKGYFSVFGDEEKSVFDFLPLKKTDDINAYFLADVHKRFDEALECAEPFEADTDFYIINGDIGEVESDDDYYKVIDFLGKLTKGMKPVLFARGNHDARGREAEMFTYFYPSDSGKTYFEFSIGTLSGVVLDCGEDKLDSHAEYGGANVFEKYRRVETEFLKSKKKNSDGGIFFAVCHICPVMTTSQKEDIFDIEREVYTKWSAELERLGTRFMLCGHIHRSRLLLSDDSDSIIPHKYPVVFASHLADDGLWGAYINITQKSLIVSMTDRMGTEKEKYILDI